MPYKLALSLNMEPHPEGGFYKRIYQSDNAQYYDSHSAERFSLTAILYLLTAEDRSAFHRIKSDEIWMLGEHNSPVIIHELSGQGYCCYQLDAQKPFHSVKAGTWFSAELQDKSATSYALSYCAVSPGFDFDDFELADSQALALQYPAHSSLIERLSLG